MDILKPLITCYTGKEKEKELRIFIDKNIAGYEKTKAVAFDVLRLNTGWLERNKTVLQAYFSE
jgi:hypothetical protein